jgi:hypothetical protein
MKEGKMIAGQVISAFVAVFCSFGTLGADKAVNASSFGWNPEDSTAAL